MFELLLQAAGGKKLSPGDVERLRLELAGVERAVARTAAQAQGGNSQAAKFDKLIVTGDVDLPAGVVNVGPYASGKSNARLASGGLQLRNYATVKIDLQSDGDIFVGSNVAQPAATYLSIFSNIQTYNGEAVGAGDMLIGDNSASKANILWQKSTGRLNFRGGTTIQAYVDTTGAITAGAGAVTIDSNGITLLTGSGRTNQVTWNSSTGVRVGGIYVNNTGTANAPEGDLQIIIQSQAITSTLEISASTFQTILNNNLLVQQNGTITLGLNVGTATAAATGTLKLLGAATGSTLIDARPATGALADAGYIFVNNRARFGWDGTNMVIDDNSGGKVINIGNGAATGGISINAAKVGFFGALVVRPAAYTQTYATASRTHSNPVAVAPGAYVGGTNGYSTTTVAQAVRDAAANLVSDLANVKQVLNSVIDDLQADGLLQ